VSARLKTGQVLEDKYTIVRQVGGGGMGIVYEAEHMALNVRVAIKVLHPTEADDPNVLARFKAEARSAAGIRHRNVVDVTDFGLTPDRRPFFVMEYLTGESLADRLDRRKALNEREAVEITDQILSGLAAAHKKGIIHRDLKPENVWLAKGEDGAETVKLLDFGIAKIVGSSVASRNVPTVELSSRPTTQQGIVLGTPGYMAPESITVGGGSDARSDLFAVGVLLYEMIVGRRPFNGVTVHEIMMSTATDPVPQPSVLKPEISPAMERLILTSLAKEPCDRFQSAEEFLRHLTAAAVGRIPDNARPCVTRVGMPSVIPPAALKRVKMKLPDPVAELSRSRSGDALRRSGLSSSRTDLGLRQSATAGPRPELRRSRELSRSAIERGGLSKTGDRGAHKKSRRRLSLPISPFAIVLLLGLGAAFYFLYLRDGPWREIGHEEAWKLNGRTPAGASADPGTEAFSAKASSSASEEKATGGTVTIWIDVEPVEAHLTLNGSPIADRPFTVPRGDAPIQLRATAPGKEPLTVDVVPDRDRTVQIRLRPSGGKPN
jgi:serine/threonine protein kinase